MKTWSLVSEASGNVARQNDAIGAWRHLFAKHVETICKAYGVPLDILLQYLHDFEQQIANDIVVQRWAQGYATHHEVGWEEAAKAVDTSIRDVRDRFDEFVVLGLRITLTFPYIPIPEKPTGENAVREVYFPLPGVSGDPGTTNPI